MKIPVKVCGLPVNRVILLVAAATLFMAVLVPCSGQGLAEETQPVRVVVHGIEVSGGFPAVMMSDRVYLPDLFVAGILGYPFQWEPKTRTVRMGVPQDGVDMVSGLPAYTGAALAEPVIIKAKSYSNGFAIDGNNTVRWNLHGVVDRVTFSYGMTDGQQEDSVGFNLLQDGKVTAGENVSKADGLKEFSFDVGGVYVLTVKQPDGQAGGVLIDPRGFQN
ncbi:MAG: hypothetical protein A4E55_02330 [Pelotomaculum sp. PtaU1.Bin035]|nr:MAG: hypothetical protein A4E55_02330 [Pelotomaculum sp. PtaU1.Bin035]